MSPAFDDESVWRLVSTLNKQGLVMEHYFITVFRNAFKERRIVGYFATPESALAVLTSPDQYIDRMHRPGYWRFAVVEAISSDLQQPSGGPFIWHMYEDDQWKRVATPERMRGVACITFDGVTQ